MTHPSWIPRPSEPPQVPFGWAPGGGVKAEALQVAGMCQSSSEQVRSQTSVPAGSQPDPAARMRPSVGVCKGAAHLGHTRTGVWEGTLLTSSGLWVCSPFLFEREKAAITPARGDSPCDPDRGWSSSSSVPAHSSLERTLRAGCKPIPGGFLTPGVRSLLPTALRFPNSISHLLTIRASEVSPW